MADSEITIIGGGLAGLATAYFLKKEGYSSTIIEARDRLGGRIHTLRKEGEAPIEMGATWLGKKHKHLINLLEELDIGIYEQYMGEKAYYEPISTSPPQLVTLPVNEDPTYRIEGGTSNLIHTLAKILDQAKIILGDAVESIQRKEDAITIRSAENNFKTDVVISTLPPKLLAETITFDPSLPDALIETALNTHTWMSESIKIGLSYSKPFWQNKHSSGTIMSNVGPVTEMYDHSNRERSLFALKGFMNEAYHAVSKEKRIELVMNQLTQLYGDKARSFLSYLETVWKHEPYTYSSYDGYVIPHQNNGHSLFDKDYWDGQLLIGGSETANAFPGYMDGAVESALNIARKLSNVNLK